MSYLILQIAVQKLNKIEKQKKTLKNFSSSIFITEKTFTFLA
jgi:hypothetical protein